MIRSELSEKNPYWIERHRYHELKQFCLQYPIWKKTYESIDGLLGRPADLSTFGKAKHISNPTERNRNHESVLFRAYGYDLESC